MTSHSPPEDRALPPWPISDRLRDYLAVQYELLRVLGTGGIRTVLLANERALDRLVAIKVLGIGISIGVGRAYRPIADRVSTDERVSTFIRNVPVLRSVELSPLR